MSVLIPQAHSTAQVQTQRWGFAGWVQANDRRLPNRCVYSRKKFTQLLMDSGSIRKEVRTEPEFGESQNLFTQT